MDENEILRRFLPLTALKGRSILFDSKSPQSRNSFVFSFLNETLSAGIPAIYFSFDHSTELLKSQKLISEKFKLVDCYSSTPSYESLCLELNNFTESFKGPYFIAFNSLSSFLAFNAPNTLYHFLFFEHSRLRARNSIALHCIDSGLHDRKVFELLQKLTDVHLRATEEENFNRICVLPSSKNFFGFKVKEFLFS